MVKVSLVSMVAVLTEVNVTQTQSYGENSVNKHSAESRRFSSGSPVSSDRES